MPHIIGTLWCSPVPSYHAAAATAALQALGPRYSLDIRCTWNSTRNTDVHAHELKPSEPAFRELSSLQSIDHAAAEAEALAERRDREREQSRQVSMSCKSCFELQTCRVSKMCSSQRWIGRLCFESG
jgi:hypothetical protein